MPYVKKVSKNKNSINNSLNISFSKSSSPFSSKDEKGEKMKIKKLYLI